MLIYKCTFCCNSIFKLYMLTDQGKNWDVSKIMEIQKRTKKTPTVFLLKYLKKKKKKKNILEHIHHAILFYFKIFF